MLCMTGEVLNHARSIFRIHSVMRSMTYNLNSQWHYFTSDR
jgi:hypothetical protein